jgi:tRNA(adenine34) deaminase
LFELIANKSTFIISEAKKHNMHNIKIINDKDIFFMNRALTYAKKAYDSDEVPVGAVIESDGRIIASAFNMRETSKNALCHAEIDAIRRACKRLGGWRLSGCTIYVTLEPCPMCAGAIINARINRVVYGAKDSRAGAFGSVMNLNNYPLNHKPVIVPGVCADECGALISRFFYKLRKKRNNPD